MSRAVWPAADHPLNGVRLGKMERHLLACAPSPEAHDGYVIEDAERSIREGLRRAATKLERVGLLERLPMGVYVRARDARREGLHFGQGRFYRYVESTRAHAVRRNVVWLSPFGDAIMLLYGEQIRAGERVRWDARTVSRARSRADTKSLDRHFRWRDAIDVREDAERYAVLFPDATARARTVTPDDVETKEDLKRWKLAISVAGQRTNSADAGALWKLCHRLYRTQDLKSLAGEAEGARRSTRAEQFRRQRRPTLSIGPAGGVRP